MKFVGIFVAVALSLLAASDAAITRPDQVLAQLDAVEEDIFGYQTTILDQINTLRTESGGKTADHYNQTLTVIEENIQAISDSDTGIRTNLGAQTPGACITNLQNFLDQLIELSGYAISNCVEDDNSTTDATAELMALLDQVEREAGILPQSIIDALIGRNIFTEGDAIIARINELFVEHKTVIETLVAEATAQIAELGTSADSGVATLTSCFGDIVTSVNGGISMLEVQIATCSKFGGRAPRSFLPDPIDFFPQLK